MTMDVNHTPVRVDLRCALCQQKSAFVCEHDTPYRDQYLGIFDSNAPRDILINRQGSKNEPKTHDNSISNGGMNTGRQVNSNAGGGDAQHQQQNINRQGAKSEPKTYNNSKSNGGMNTGRQVNFNAGDGGAQHQQEKKSNKTNVDPQHTDESSKIHEQDQKSKSCIIL